jgi:CobN/Magnesium Chelatase
MRAAPPYQGGSEQGLIDSCRRQDLPPARAAMRPSGCLKGSWAAPQDMASWVRDGIAGLQSVVLYSLPELDGAIDTVPLGGLVGDNIFLVQERVRRLAGRLKKWVALRRTPPEVGHPNFIVGVACRWESQCLQLRKLAFSLRPCSMFGRREGMFANPAWLAAWFGMFSPLFEKGKGHC